MTVTFSINGKPYSVDLEKLPADITLNTFIRDHAGLTGTKFMCQEGGCGVCTCVVTSVHPATKAKHTWSVNSCLTLLNSCVGWDITTIEGLGGKRNGYHPIQKRLTMLNGTQCGYCSPGFVMNMFGLLESKGGKVTMEEVENSFGGNICRCTGYRPILDAMKSFATDSNIEVPAECRDIEDLGLKKCPKTGDACSGYCALPIKQPSSYPDGSKWYWARSMFCVFKAISELKNDKYMLVSGNTAHGVYRRPTDIETFINVSNVTELTQHTITKQALTLGGNLSLTETMTVFEEAATRPGFEYCKQLWKHFDLIANVPVRNSGTLAGNLSIKHQHPEFPSDVFVAFKALDVHITIHSSELEHKTVSLSEYLRMDMRKKVITSFLLKPYPKEQYIFDSYKIMPRAQNAHAYVNAAFLIGVDGSATQKVQSARICFGGINPDFVHATKVEQYLVGKSLFDAKTAEQALRLLHGSLKPDAVLPDASPEYRQKLAVGLFYKALLAHMPKNTLPKKLASGGGVLQRPVSSGKQIFDTPPENEEFPIYKATAKLEGLIQTAGEAAYANDVSALPNQVWVAFVTAKQIGATVVDFDDSEALNLPGVVAFLSAKDIPGENKVSGNDAFFFPELQQLFATGPIKYYDQPVGIIAAESNALAHHAANLVKLTYSSSSKAQVLVTVADVRNSASGDRIRHAMKSPIAELKLPDAFDCHENGRLDMGAQYHFFMEPHTTVAVPCEDGIYLHTSTQWMDLVQGVVCKFLSLKHNEVQVKVRRIGGGYGGKATNSTFAACAAALAAYRLNRPARFVQSIESMMTTLGKRWPFLSEYEFWTKRNGKIVGIRNSFYHEGGFTLNEPPSGHAVLLSKNCYLFSDNYKVDGYQVVTDTPNNISCRAPGSIEGIAMIENVIEHIAFTTGVDPLDVRLANMLPGHKMDEMLPHFVETTHYRQRKQEVAEYNAQNRWRKRGLGLAVMEYHIGYFGQFPVTVAIYHGDGTVIITHGGIEMGQGINTKIAQVAANALNLPMSMIRIECSDTLNGANAMVTGGSIGSEVVCFATRKCCDTLNERLRPVREELKNPSWSELVEKAYSQNLNLIASDHCKQGELEPYTVCGCCLTEVEVDLLTGNYLVTRVDLLEDTGISLNPNVDIGQIEGAFMMGLGYWTSEEIIHDPKTGELLTNRTWNYKPPGAKDIPIDFRIEFMPKSKNPAGFMRSKATGEPAICVAVAVVFAFQEALQSARNDAGLPKQWINLSAPMTPEHILLNAGIELGMMRL